MTPLGALDHVVPSQCRMVSRKTSTASEEALIQVGAIEGMAEDYM
jgi:hypothetical protein